MGLGPKGSSLIDRCGHDAAPWRDPFAMQLEQQDRLEQRRLKAIWWAMKHKKAQKPEAPVLALKKVKGVPRQWKWWGEDIISTGMLRDGVYFAEDIRKAGFKLPKIGGKKNVES